MSLKERDITRLNIQKLPMETPDAYQAFLAFARLKYKDRNCENVVKETGYSIMAVKSWQSENNWIERANVLDAEEDVAIREDRMRLLKQDNIRYAEKTRHIKEKAFEVGEQMVDAAKDLLSNIKFIDKVVETGEVETIDGRMVKTFTEIHMKAKVSDIPRLADTGMKITQLAAGLPTEIVESNAIDTQDLSKLTREEIIALIEENDQKIHRISGESKLKTIG